MTEEELFSYAPGVRQYANRNHWTTVDGMLHTSVPARMSPHWSVDKSDPDAWIYSNGEYEIVARPYGPRRRSYEVYRGDERLALSFTGQLKVAKAYAERNARGEDTVNVA